MGTVILRYFTFDIVFAMEVAKRRFWFVAPYSAFSRVFVLGSSDCRHSRIFFGTSIFIFSIFFSSNFGSIVSYIRPYILALWQARWTWNSSLQPVHVDRHYHLYSRKSAVPSFSSHCFVAISLLLFRHFDCIFLVVSIWSPATRREMQNDRFLYVSNGEIKTRNYSSIDPSS